MDSNTICDLFFNFLSLFKKKKEIQLPAVVDKEPIYSADVFAEAALSVIHENEAVKNNRRNTVLSNKNIKKYCNNFIKHCIAQADSNPDFVTDILISYLDLDMPIEDKIFIRDFFEILKSFTSTYKVEIGMNNSNHITVNRASFLNFVKMISSEDFKNGVDNITTNSVSIYR